MDRPSARAPSGTAQVRTAAAGVQRFSPAFRYGFAVIVTMAALLLKLALGPIILPSLYVPFYGAVLLSAWVGGVGPGIVSSVLSFGIGQVLFVPPPGSQTAVVELAMVRDALFLIAAIGLSAREIFIGWAMTAEASPMTMSVHVIRFWFIRFVWPIDW